MLNETQLNELMSKSETMNKYEFDKLLTSLNDKYYNSQNDVDIPDDYYDMLKDNYENRFGEWIYIGADVDEKLKIKLPFWLGSQDKYKPVDKKKIKSWKKKYKKDTIIEPKLDGVSGLLEIKSGIVKLFTRGNGTYGTDISNLVRYLKLPKIDEDLYIRGELIISKNKFETKFKKDFKNARNLVSGVVNSKKVNTKAAKSIDFIVYEILGKKLKPEDQVNYLKTLGFKTPMYKILKDIDENILEKELLEMRTKCIYEIDGIVCTNNEIYVRNKSSNPKYAFAFKIPPNATRTKVIGVQWNASKHSFLKPRVEIEKVHIQGSDISWATGFNAKYIYNNKIGKGTIIDIVKSGDVIPYIQHVVKATKPDMPPDGTYIWNDTRVDIIIVGENKQVYAKRILYFFSKLEIKGIGQRTSEKFVDNGVDTISKVISCKVSDFESMSFGPVESKNLYNNIRDGIKNVKLARLMGATSIFGFGMGEKKIKLILNQYPDITTLKVKVEDIKNIDGWSEKSAVVFLEKLIEFKKFLKDNKKISYTNDKQDKTGKYVGLKVVFSGTTGKELIEQMGATKMSSVSKKTDLLVVVDKNNNSGKIKKAQELGIKIVEISELNL